MDFEAGNEAIRGEKKFLDIVNQCTVSISVVETNYQRVIMVIMIFFFFFSF